MTLAAMTATAATTGAATAGGMLLAAHLPLLGVISALIAAIFFGVILPAVWSTKPERRAAALATLKELLATARRSRP